jgi:hypothetical protein
LYILEDVMTEPVSAIGAALPSAPGRAAMLEMPLNQPMQVSLFAGPGAAAGSGNDMRGDITSMVDTASRLFMKTDTRAEELMAERQRWSAAPPTIENYQQAASADLALFRHHAESLSALQLSTSLAMSVVESFKSLLRTTN